MESGYRQRVVFAACERHYFVPVDRADPNARARQLILKSGPLSLWPRTQQLSPCGKICFVLRDVNTGASVSSEPRARCGVREASGENIRMLERTADGTKLFLREPPSFMSWCSRCLPRALFQKSPSLHPKPQPGRTRRAVKGGRRPPRSGRDP